MVKNFLNDENGAVVSIELVLIITIAVLALIVGWSEVAVAVNAELDDISNAVGKFDQSWQHLQRASHGPAYSQAPLDHPNRGRES